jgi:hypothetical protein
MQSVNRALLLGVMALLVATAACGGGEEEEAAAAAAAAAEEIEVSPEAMAAAERLAARLAEGISLVPTQRGQAEIGYTQPVARRGTGSERGFNITSIRIRNLSQNAIAGFQVDEFWYDTDGNTVTGDQARRRQPILVGEVCDIELRVPRVTAMDRSNYEFSHQNGDIKATLLEDIEDPPQPEVEEGEEAEAEETEEAGEAEGEEAEPTEEELRFTCLRPAEMTDEPAAVEDNAG